MGKTMKTNESTSRTVITRAKLKDEVVPNPRLSQFLAGWTNACVTVKPEYAIDMVTARNGKKVPVKRPVKTMPKYPPYISDVEYYENTDEATVEAQHKQWFSTCKKCAYSLSNTYTTRTVGGAVKTLSNKTRWDVNPTDQREIMESKDGMCLHKTIYGFTCKMGVGFKDWTKRVNTNLGLDETENGVLRRIPSCETGRIAGEDLPVMPAGYYKKCAVAPEGTARTDDSPDCRICSDLGCTMRLSAPENEEGLVDEDFDPAIDPEAWECPRGYAKRDYLYELPAEPSGMFYIGKKAICEEYVNLNPFLWKSRWAESLNLKRAVHFLRTIRKITRYANWDETYEEVDKETGEVVEKTRVHKSAVPVFAKSEAIRKYYARNLLHNLKNGKVRIDKQKYTIVRRGAKLDDRGVLIDAGKPFVTYSHSYLALLEELRLCGVLKSMPKLKEDIELTDAEAKMFQDKSINLDIVHVVNEEDSEYDGRPKYRKFASMVLNGEIKSLKSATKQEQWWVKRMLEAKEEVNRRFGGFMVTKDGKPSHYFLPEGFKTRPRLLTKWGFWNLVARSTKDKSKGSDLFGKKK